eukprot:1536281-Prymnesium_polylepis.1
MSFLGARGPAVAAGSTLALCGCTAVWVHVWHRHSVHLPRLVSCATSNVHVLHVRNTAAWIRPRAVICRTIGDTPGSRSVSDQSVYLCTIAYS